MSRKPLHPRSVFLAPLTAAGLAGLQKTEATFSHTQYFADQKLNYAAVGTNLGGFGTLGFNAKILSIGDVIVTTEDAPEGTGEIATRGARRRGAGAPRGT